MAKRNSSGSSSGRRGASRSTRGNGAASGGRKSGGKPFKKSDKPYGRRDEGSSEQGASSFDSRKRSSSAGPRKPPFKKFDSGDSDKPRGRSFKSDKPYGRRDEGSSEGGDRSYGNRRSSSSFGSRKPPFKRSDSGDSDKPRGHSFKSDKPYGRRDEGSSEGGDRSYGTRRSSSSSGPRKPPFRKSDSDSNKPRGRSFKSDKPYGRRDDDSSERKSRSYGNRSEGKFDKKGDDKPERSFKRSGRGESKQVQEEGVAPVQTQQIRLNRYIANSGICSRREADELIAMGLVSVNGKTITEMGYKVNPGDEVRYESKVLKAEKPVYILLNKPKGYLTTTDDPQERKTVMQLVAGAVKERIYPVGRLDRNTTGLLLLTNDGELAEKLMHPSYNVRKIYKVELDKPLTKADFQTISEGVMLEEGRAVVDDLAIVSNDGKTIGIEIHIGWNRVVRRIFESLSYEVVRLDRSVYAGLDKKDLGRGEWRFLKKEEIVRLKHFK